ncbi:hypothetical protein [Bacillus coahuilensis]|uniref:hypothetical protein n=1 Tax=Bacillus coahuilensis TaxID=408580 RepID=UPI0001851126|nr:hypothetical protein [Bacillus coahuilensis]
MKLRTRKPFARLVVVLLIMSIIFNGVKSLDAAYRVKIIIVSDETSNVSQNQVNTYGSQNSNPWWWPWFPWWPWWRF